MFDSRINQAKLIENGLVNAVRAINAHNCTTFDGRSFESVVADAVLREFFGMPPDLPDRKTWSCCDHAFDNLSREHSRDLTNFGLALTREVKAASFEVRDENGERDGARAVPATLPAAWSKVSLKVCDCDKLVDKISLLIDRHTATEEGINAFEALTNDLIQQLRTVEYRANSVFHRSVMEHRDVLIHSLSAIGVAPNTVKKLFAQLEIAARY